MIVWKNYEMLNKISIDFITQYGHTVSKKKILMELFCIQVENFELSSILKVALWHFLISVQQGLLFFICWMLGFVYWMLALKWHISKSYFSFLLLVHSFRSS